MNGSAKEHGILRYTSLRSVTQDACSLLVDDMNKHALGSGLLLILWCGVLGLTAAFTQQLKPARPSQTSLQQMNIVSAQTTAIHFVASPPITPTEPFTTAWSHSCVVGRRMAIMGVGMGDPLQAINPQTITLADPNSVASLRVQVAGRRIGASPVPEWVVLTTDTQPLTLTKVYSPSHAYTFEVDLQATRHITALISNTGNDYKTPRGLILYSLRNTNGEWSSVGKTLSEFIYKKVHTEVLMLPQPLKQLTDVEVTAVIIDNDNDDRPLVLTATAGSAVTTSGFITGPTDGPLLNIVPLTLSHVPTYTDRITITLQSPEQNGDSLVLVGLNVSYPCSRGSADLEISQTADITTINESELITYTITVTNNGPSDAAGVSVTDKLPAGLIFGGYTATRGIYSKDTDQWNVGDLANKGTATLIITATANECSGASIVNTAVVTAATDSNPDNNEATASVTSTVGAYCIYLPIILHNPCSPTDTFTTRYTSPNQWPKKSNPYIMDYDENKGEYRIQTAGPSSSLLFSHSLLYVASPLNVQFYKYDYSIRADIHWNNSGNLGKEYGLIFALIPEGEFSAKQAYRFLLNNRNGDYRLERHPHPNQSPTDFWGPVTSGNASEYLDITGSIISTNTLEIVHSYNNIYLYINNHFITQTNNYIPAKVVQVGLGVLSKKGQIGEARFDNFVYCQPGLIKDNNLGTTALDSLPIITPGE